MTFVFPPWTRFSGGPIKGFRKGWAILPFVGGFGKPHWWERIDLSNQYRAACGLRGALATREMLIARGLVNAESGIEPLSEGDHHDERCKRCQRKRAKR